MPPASSHTSRAGVVSRRTRTVWASLTASMTAVGGLLFLLAGGTPATTNAGVALSPLVSTTSPGSLESVFRTRVALSPVWDTIVIHDSGSPVGDAASLDAAARAQGLTGLGYHFVVGNGSGMGDGEIHVGYRWLDQLPGAHVAGAAGDTLNRTSIGICLVGDGDRRAFSDEEIHRAAQLAAALADRFGIPPERIILHRDVAETTSPGRYFPAARFREQVRALLP